MRGFSSLSSPCCRAVQRSKKDDQIQHVEQNADPKRGRVESKMVVKSPSTPTACGHPDIAREQDGWDPPVVFLHLSFMVEWYVVQDALPSPLRRTNQSLGLRQVHRVSLQGAGPCCAAHPVLLAATSHDYWLVFLTPSVWKGLHMALYVAYGLILMHVALGVMQYDHNPFLPAMLASSFGWVAVLHLVAGWRERARDRAGFSRSDGWLPVGPPLSIPDKGARIVVAPDGERIAVFRDGAQIGALSNLCAHQNGPIGEGRIIDGCVTCPWHGYQYRLEDGCAPPPFTEKLVTYRVRVAHGVVEVDPRPLPKGTSAAMKYE
jgi:nitrite reductase/ring-hydroxylating ferredoxin subunit